MEKEPQFYPKQPGAEVPPKTEFLVRNIKRRKRLLEKISQQLTGRNIEVPEIFIKEKTFFRFLTESYKRIRSKMTQETLDKYEISNLQDADQKIINEINDSTLKRIKDFNKRVFVLINRLSFVSKRKEPTTAIVTALYDRPKKGVDLLADDFSTFLGKVKKLAVLLKEKEIPLESITGMQNGLGIPDLKKLTEFIDFVNKNKVNGKEIPLESITGMQHGLGIPDLKKLEELIDFLKRKNLDIQQFIKQISGKRSGKGIPSIEELEAGI